MPGEKCKATTKAGLPCPMPAMGKVTPGYCVPHDPGITLEMRQEFAKGFGLPGDQKAATLRRLRTPDDIMAYVEELLNKWEKGPGAALTVETIDCLANLLRIQLGAIKEKNAGKKGAKKDKPVSWREVG